jgi:hypothetical protein
MKVRILSTLLLLLLPSILFASYTPYCKGTEVNNIEDAVIQRLVPQFGLAMGCEIGDNCLLKWDEKGNTEKFSIAWKKQCAPQLGDNGHGSTFVCQFKNNKKSICCWPLGFDHVKKYTLCSDSIIKDRG